jgi:hypothetical protein
MLLHNGKTPNKGSIIPIFFLTVYVVLSGIMSVDFEFIILR